MPAALLLCHAPIVPNSTVQFMRQRQRGTRFKRGVVTPQVQGGGHPSSTGTGGGASIIHRYRGGSSITHRFRGGGIHHPQVQVGEHPSSTGTGGGVCLHGYKGGGVNAYASCVGCLHSPAPHPAVTSQPPTQPSPPSPSPSRHLPHLFTEAEVAG